MDTSGKMNVFSQIPYAFRGFTIFLWFFSELLFRPLTEPMASFAFIESIFSMV